MKLDPQTNGTLKVELSAVDRRSLNKCELMLQLIEQHEAAPDVRSDAADGSCALKAILEYYREKVAGPQPAPPPTVEAPT